MKKLNELNKIPMPFKKVDNNDICKAQEDDIEILSDYKNENFTAGDKATRKQPEQAYFNSSDAEAFRHMPLSSRNPRENSIFQAKPSYENIYKDYSNQSENEIKSINHIYFNNSIFKKIEEQQHTQKQESLRHHHKNKLSITSNNNINYSPDKNANEEDTSFISEEEEDYNIDLIQNQYNNGRINSYRLPFGNLSFQNLPGYNNNNTSNNTSFNCKTARPENFNDLIQSKLSEYKSKMMEFFDSSRLELEELYKKLLQKTIKISHVKARRISHLYNRDLMLFPSISHSILNPSELKLDKDEIENNPIKNSESHEILPNYEKLSSQASFGQNKAIDYNTIKNNPSNKKIFSENKNFSKTNSNTNPYFASSAELNNINNRISLTNDVFKAKNPNMKIDDVSNFNVFGTEEDKRLNKLRDYANKIVIEKLTCMFKLHESLTLSIEQNFQLLRNFLNEFDLDSSNPLQDFINSNAENICNSWFLPKINFENLNLHCFMNNNQIPKTFKNYIYNEDSKNKFNSYTIQKTDKPAFDLDRKVLKNNYMMLSKLTLSHLVGKADMRKIFFEDDVQKLNFDKMRKLNFKKSSLENLNYLNFFPNLAFLSFKQCSFLEMPSDFNLTFPNLQQVAFEKCNLSTEQAVFLMRQFENLKHLEKINLAENKITAFSLKNIRPLESLQSLILRRNKISDININKEIIEKYFPKLEILDLYSNNIMTFDSIKFEDFRNTAKDLKLLILLGKNLCMSSRPLAAKKYIKYLTQNLSQKDFNLTSLDLSYSKLKTLKEKEPIINLKDLQLNTNVQIYLKKIDLSFNNLTDEDLIVFLSENKDLVNIKEISLKKNNLTEKFLTFLTKINQESFFEYLKILDISSNKIDFSALDTLSSVIRDYKNLKRVNLTHNPIQEKMHFFLSKNKQTLKEEEENAINSFFNQLKNLKTKQKRTVTLGLFENLDLLENKDPNKIDIINNFILIDF